MSCGCLAAQAKTDWLALSPFLLVVAVLLTLGMFSVYPRWEGLMADVGNQTAPQEVYFGTECRKPDVARFVVPIFRHAATPEVALGSNIAGAVVGGTAEALSMPLVFCLLLVVALVFYLIAVLSSAGLVVAMEPQRRSSV